MPSGARPASTPRRQRPALSCRGRALGRRLRRDLDVVRPGRLRLGIYAQRYDAIGNAVGSETRVNATTASRPAHPAVAALSDGGYVVTWMSRPGRLGYGIYSRTFTQEGNHAPQLAGPISDQSSSEDQAWSFQVPANTFSDVDGDALTYSASLGDGSALPSWVTFDAATRTFSGTPPLNFNGALELKVWRATALSLPPTSSNSR